MSDTLYALWASLVRTIVPLVVGFVVSGFVAAGIELDSEFSGLLANGLTVLLSGLYYTGARLLETYVTPKFGWLLLFPKSPTGYASAGVTSDTPSV